MKMFRGLMVVVTINIFSLVLTISMVLYVMLRAFIELL